MSTIVFSTLWGQPADGVLPPASARTTEDRANDLASDALVNETPDVIDLATCAFPAAYVLNGKQLEGYCIMAAVKVQHDVQSLDERLVLSQQVENTLKRALGTLFGFLLAHSLKTMNESELRRSIGSRESLRG